MGTISSSPKSVVREMAQDGLISNPAYWIEAIDHRNLSVHTYDEKLAKQVYAFAKEFINELYSLRDQFEK
jgi:nucleotidyltransferase substrate binding protein (TIGR01987 family)